MNFLGSKGKQNLEEEEMAWTTPRIVEVCVGMEVNAYFPADF